MQGGICLELQEIGVFCTSCGAEKCNSCKSVAGGLKDKGMLSKDANLDIIVDKGVYIVADGHSVLKSGCILYVVKVGVYVQQIAIGISKGFFSARIKGYSGEWYNWMQTPLSPLA